ncbi:MAG: GTP-binding protein [Methanobacteriota archaeon]|nr:MAG: GTP-binding protein [Euryarchaeota archaeon]
MSVSSANYMAKIVLLGDGAVGKTSLRRMYLGKGFNQSHLMTIGADFATTNIQIGDEVLNTQIWDIAGQQNFKMIRQRFLVGSHGAMIVYDVTRPSSFHNLSSWLNELWTTNRRTDIPLLFIGNKTDLVNQRKVSKKEAEKFVNEVRLHPRLRGVPILYIETSAKMGENVVEAFQLLGKEIVSKFKARRL